MVVIDLQALLEWDSALVAIVGIVLNKGDPVAPYAFDGWSRRGKEVIRRRTLPARRGW